MELSGFKQWAIKTILFNLLVSTATGHNLATITPCPECDQSIAPKLVTVTAQYQTVPTCKPSTTTEVLSSTKQQYGSAVVETITTTKTVPSCKSYAWVSTTIPAYYNGTKTSTVVTTTDQPVTFSSLHYTETHTTTVTLPQRPKWNYGSQQNNTRNATHPMITTKLSYTTIDVKDYCDYDSIGPIAIGGYQGSGLCTDCGPDASSALTQRLTVVSCADKHCTTFNETWIARPKTYSSEGATHTTTTTNTYCPTATPTSAIPGYTNSAPTGTATSTPAPSPYPGGDSHSSSAGGYSGSSTTPNYPGTTTPGTSASGYPAHTTTTTCTDSQSQHGTPTGYPGQTSTYPDDEPEPTDGYGDGGEPEPYPDPSGDLGYDDPAPTTYHPSPEGYKLFRKRGLEKPRGRVMKRSGLLFFEE